MFTIILDTSPEIASKFVLVVVSVAIISASLVLYKPRKKGRTTKKPVSVVEAGSGRNSIAVWGLSASARHPQSGFTFTAPPPPGEAARKGEARIRNRHR
jgi:hypothetical protein